jgi:hypothetical protein
MLCADIDLPVLPRVERIVSVAGVHDLRPLLRTAMNDILGLDPATAAAESPALALPRPGVPVTAWVGAAERPEFRRQAALLANVWWGLGVETSCIESPGENHFTVVEALADPASPLCAALLGDAPVAAAWEAAEARRA